MEDIKVNEYVRTTDGIKKIVQVNEGKLSTYYGKYIVSPEYKNSKSINIKNILKHSPNIIDLIEVGDYVNGMEVLDIYTPRDLWEPIEIRVDSRYMNYLTSEDIKTILTKEQYKANCYEVK